MATRRVHKTAVTMLFADGATCSIRIRTRTRSIRRKRPPQITAVFPALRHLVIRTRTSRTRTRRVSSIHTGRRDVIASMSKRDIGEALCLEISDKIAVARCIASVSLTTTATALRVSSVPGFVRDAGPSATSRLLATASRRCALLLCDAHLRAARWPTTTTSSFRATGGRCLTEAVSPRY